MLNVKKHGCANLPVLNQFVSFLLTFDCMMDVKMLARLDEHAAKNNFAVFPIETKIYYYKLTHCEPFHYKKTVAYPQFS